jgi:hypothetical protein
VIAPIRPPQNPTVTATVSRQVILAKAEFPSPLTLLKDPGRRLPPVAVMKCGIGLDRSGPGARVHLGSPRQCLRVDVLLDPRQLAASNGDIEDPLILERLIRGFDFPGSDADD